jgi:hypothetical protein
MDLEPAVAAAAEYDPYASNLFVTPLSCSLVGRTMDVMLKPGSLVVATLFVPQFISTARYPHPLIAAFVKAAVESERVRAGEVGFRLTRTMLF